MNTSSGDSITVIGIKEVDLCNGHFAETLSPSLPPVRVLSHSIPFYSFERCPKQTTTKIQSTVHLYYFVTDCSILDKP